MRADGLADFGRLVLIRRGGPRRFVYFRGPILPREWREIGARA